jgi:signal transduction histidine kinase/CheY-like chemotaxis protein
MWYYTFPLFSLALLGLRGGSVFTIALFLPAIGFLFYDLTYSASPAYNLDFTIRFIPSFLTVFLFAYMFERSRANAMNKLKQAYDEQEHIIEQRTEELRREVLTREEYSRKLRQVQKMEALGLMAGGVAHDLNNILSGIMTYPELLLMRLPADSDLRKPLEAILESGKRSAAVVNDLLTMARGVASPREPCNINDIIKEYLQSPEFEKLSAYQAEIRFKIDLHPQLRPVSCCSAHIRKCIMNMTINAMESMDGSGTVTIKTFNKNLDSRSATEPRLEEGQYVVFRIEDTGLGIRQEDRDRIFEPFYSKKIMGRSGTGLGLTVVWNTVHDHDGGIAFESGESGTRFDLYFPASEEKIPERKIVNRTEPPKGNGEKILVVDDELRQKEVACAALASLGYTPDSVSSGEEALEYLKKNDVSLVMLDMLMEPGMNGGETFERIKKLRPTQKALIVSGYAETEDVRGAIDRGAKGFVKKPYTLAQLAHAIHDCLINQ